MADTLREQGYIKCPSCRYYTDSEARGRVHRCTGTGGAAGSESAAELRARVGGLARMMMTCPRGAVLRRAQIKGALLSAVEQLERAERAWEGG
jgi:hypothetical protein